MRKFITYLIIFSFFEIFSQSNNFYDFIVLKNNDTIFGKYQIEKFTDLNGKKTPISENIVSIKKNDLIYESKRLTNKGFTSVENDSLIRIDGNEEFFIFEKQNLFYFHNLKKNLRKDYLITSNKDTIFGTIKTRNNINKYKFQNLSFKIKGKNTIKFRKGGFEYIYKKKRRVFLSDEKHSFLKLILKGKVNLYEYKTIRNTGYSRSVETHYYIERNKTLTFLNNLRFYKIIEKTLPENKILLEKIKNKQFDYKDVYLIVKYFNEYTEL